MHALAPASDVKREGQPVNNVYQVAGPIKQNFLLHVTDTKRGEKWLVDGGALLSILPPTPQQRLRGPNNIKLKAANGSDISCYGSCDRTITIGDQSFDFTFVIADVQTRILGADFLARNYLAPNHRDALLLNLQDYSTLPAEHARGITYSPVNFVHQIDDPYYQLLDSYPEILTPSFTLKEPVHGVRHHIPTKEGPPVQSRARRLDPEKLAVAKAEIEKLVDLGVCYRGKSEWSSPLLVTTKPCGGWRVCGDYRRLNNLTTDDRYPVRTLQDFTSELHGMKVFSKVDLMKGYHQIPVADEDVKKTAVITPFGLFIFPRTPFGLKNAGQDFQRLMDEILGDIPRVFVYIDDILVASENMEQHLQDLDVVFKTLAANGLVVQRSKCVLGQPALEFLGYAVDENGIAPLPERVVAIRATTPPTSVKELQRFLGMVGYYRKFIPKAASHMYHLFEALKGKPKSLEWTADCQASFEAIKEALAGAALLFHPRPGATLALTTDASNLAIGGVLEQRGPRGWEPLAFYSSKLKPNEKMWPPYDRELLGAFKSIRHFKHMLEGRAFTLYTDHQSLVPSLSKKTDAQTARQMYQLSCIAEYTTDIRYVEGKANLVADALSRPNEEVPEVCSISHQQQELEPNACQTTSPESPSSAPSTSESASAANNSLNKRSTPSSSPTSHAAASAAKSEAAVADLNCVIAAIGDMGVDWAEIASQQPLDPEFRELRANTRSGLNFKAVDIGQRSLIVDTSNGPARPYIPSAFRRQIFDILHGLGHPGVERTRQMVQAKVVWPNMRSDVSRWARECLQCQQAKVTRHVVPPIGEFEVPNRRFEHVNVDLVTLPLSNGFRYLLTAVDRLSRWPVAVPIVDISAQSVADAFTHGWIQHYGIPATITTDRGSQFSSDIFQQLTRTWGIRALMTAPYHPEANGLVERFHRRLKESLIALGADEPNEWYWRLPCAMLSIRTTLKPDVGASPADLVYGEGLAVPGEALPANPSTDAQLARQRASALADLRLEVARLQPTQTSTHRRPQVHLPANLQTCTHVFVRRGGVTSSLASPYVGPFRVVSRNDVNFKVAIPGRQNEVVAISRVKPAICMDEDAEAAAPDTPPPPGRRPRPPRRRQRSPATPPRTRQSASQSQQRPSSPVASESASASTRVPRRRQQPPAARRGSSVPPDSPSADDGPSTSASASRAPRRPRTPPAVRQEAVDAASDPLGSPTASPPALTAAAARQQLQQELPYQRRLFSRPGPSNFSHGRLQRPVPCFPQPKVEAAPLEDDPQPEVPQRRPNPSRPHFFSKAGASSFSRRRPDLSALIDAVHTHLGTSPDPPHPSPRGSRSAQAARQCFSISKTDAQSGFEPPSVAH